MSSPLMQFLVAEYEISNRTFSSPKMLTTLLTWEKEKRQSGPEQPKFYLPQLNRSSPFPFSLALPSRLQLQPWFPWYSITSRSCDYLWKMKNDILNNMRKTIFSTKLLQNNKLRSQNNRLWYGNNAKDWQEQVHLTMLKKIYSRFRVRHITRYMTTWDEKKKEKTFKHFIWPHQSK